MHKFISTTQTSRPHYTKRMLDSLSNCYDIANFHLYAYVEPGFPDTLEILREFDACEKTLIINGSKLGCNQNTRKALETTTAKGRTCLHIEDDVIVSRDALVMYDKWIYSKDDSFSYCLYNKIAPESYDQNKYYLELDRVEFIPWGFAISHKYVQLALANDCFSASEPYLSWDLRCANLCKQLNLKNRYIFLSRANNIGAVGGVHVPSAEWHYDNQFLHFWAGDVDVN